MDRYGAAAWKIPLFVAAAVQMDLEAAFVQDWDQTGLKGGRLADTSPTDPPRAPCAVVDGSAARQHWAPAHFGRRRGDRSPFCRQQRPPPPTLHVHNEVLCVLPQPPSPTRPSHAVTRHATSLPAPVWTAIRPALPPLRPTTRPHLRIPYNFLLSWRPTSSGTKAWVRALRHASTVGVGG